jgi:hypothetical protein
VNSSANIKVVPFDSPENPINEVIFKANQIHESSRQALYITKYLNHLKASTAIVEPTYFDRDYLNEFSKFYSKVRKVMQTRAGGYTSFLQRM